MEVEFHDQLCPVQECRPSSLTDLGISQSPSLYDFFSAPARPVFFLFVGKGGRRAPARESPSSAADIRPYSSEIGVFLRAKVWLLLSAELDNVAEWTFFFFSRRPKPGLSGPSEDSGPI